MSALSAVDEISEIVSTSINPALRSPDGENRGTPNIEGGFGVFEEQERRFCSVLGRRDFCEGQLASNKNGFSGPELRMFCCLVLGNGTSPGKYGEFVKGGEFSSY